MWKPSVAQEIENRKTWSPRAWRWKSGPWPPIIDWRIVAVVFSDNWNLQWPKERTKKNFGVGMKGSWQTRTLNHSAMSKVEITRPSRKLRSERSIYKEGLPTSKESQTLEGWWAAMAWVAAGGWKAHTPLWSPKEHYLGCLNVTTGSRLYLALVRSSSSMLTSTAEYVAQPSTFTRN